MNDADLIKFVQEFRDGILDGHSSQSMCFMVCAPLVTLLNLHGVQCEMIESDNGLCHHFWIRLADGRALDPTADQFNALFNDSVPPVYLGPPGKYQGVLPAVAGQ